MGAYYHHHCDCCGYAFETSGPWEFFETDPHEDRFSGHRGSICDSNPAQKFGVLGLRARVFCLGCGRFVNLVLAKHMILARIEKSRRRLLEDLWTNQPEGFALPKVARLPPCPHCGKEKLVLGYGPRSSAQCPHCGAGTLLACAV